MIDARTTLIVLSLALATAACQPPAQEAGLLPQTDVAAIRASIDEHSDAMLAQDWDAVAAGYSDDATVMVPNAPAIEGREAIRSSYENTAATLTSYSNTPVEIEGRGDLAYARGVIALAVDVEGMPEPLSDTIKYLSILRKQPDGSWLTTHVSWNSDLPIPE